MAPFKLKFRMGSSSRSTSLETAPRLTSTSVTSSTTTIDSQFNSLGSLNNDQRNLLPAVDNDDHIGYSNPAIMQHLTESEEHSSPPSYEKTMKEKHSPNAGSSENSLLNPCIEIARSPSIAEFDSDDDLNEEPLASAPDNNGRQNNETDPLQAPNFDSNSEFEDAISICFTDDGQDEHNDQCDSHNQQIIPNTIISNKSTKKIYKEVAKQWGITCQMSEQCRCMDCQGQYFHCDYQDQESVGQVENMDAGDGGLGAGTPVFIGEVMHGSACTIL